LDGVTESLQIREHFVDPQSDDSRHILSKDPSGPGILEYVAHCRPEVAVIFLASSLPGRGPRLAGESAGDEVTSTSALESLSAPNVSEIWNSGKLSCEHFARIGFDF